MTRNLTTIVVRFITVNSFSRCIPSSILRIVIIRCVDLTEKKNRHHCLTDVFRRLIISKLFWLTSCVIVWVFDFVLIFHTSALFITDFFLSYGISIPSIFLQLVDLIVKIIINIFLVGLFQFIESTNRFVSNNISISLSWVIVVLIFWRQSHRSANFSWVKSFPCRKLTIF